MLHTILQVMYIIFLLGEKALGVICEKGCKRGDPEYRGVEDVHSLGGKSLGRLTGRVGGMFVGYSIDASLAESSITGRMGGEVVGKDLDFRFDGYTLSGRWGGALDGKDLNATLQGNRLTGRMGGDVFGWDLDLVYDGQSISGRIGGGVRGADVLLTCSPDGTVSGRIGGGVIGKDVTATAADMPFLIAAALVCATYYQLLLDQRRNSSS